MKQNIDITDQEIEYFDLLADQYPSIQAASSEIINLSAILNLPKGTEHFVSDIHGEYEAFLHVLRNGSGAIRRKIEDLFSNSLLEKEKRTLATIVYYPENKLPLVLKDIDDPREWFRITLFRLITLCRVVSSKYTRSRVRKVLPDEFAYVIEELLHEQEDAGNKHEYYNAIIDSIIDTGRAPNFIAAISHVIQRLAIDRLHILGDVYDRGPGAHIILDTLLAYDSVDFQWGNHDILWMGAAAGSEACIANVIRISLRYANTETLENGYAISLLPLATYAMDTYANDPCTGFEPRSETHEFTDREMAMMARMHKAITVIQLKLEGQIIQRQPQYEMEERLLLDKMDLNRGVVRVQGNEYKLKDTFFPTVSQDHPYELTSGERQVMERLRLSFTNSEKLQRHVRFLYAKGSMYLVYNGNLLYHGCIAMDDSGSFKAFHVDGKQYAGKAFVDRVERLARQAYFSTDPEAKRYGMDAIWYLWSGQQSPLFGKDKMATFERYFVLDRSTHKERKNAYYDFRDQEETARVILQEFGLDPDRGHIINGHVPVEVKRGESPVKAGGRLVVIDGGFSKAYQAQTGIAGYTLIFNSHGIVLASHDPFESTQTAIEKELDIHSSPRVIETMPVRLRVRDTDLGRELLERIRRLQSLLEAFRIGLVKERT
jgi:fructose-1,6-bisphosphatase-3